MFAAEALLKRRIRKVGEGESGRRREPSLTRARAPSPCCSPASLPPGPSSGRGRGGGGCCSAPALSLDLQPCTDCMDGGRGGGMNVGACTLCSVSAGVLQWAGSFGGSVWSIHLVHAFSRVFLVSSSCIPPQAHTYTRILPFASAGTHGISREMEGLVAEVSRLYAIATPHWYRGGFFLPLSPFTLKYNIRQPEKLHTHTRPPLPPLSPAPGTDA